jgi:hypothetical protein
MAWDRQTLEAEIQNEVDDFESDSLTVIRQAINDVCRTIWFRHDWTFREDTDYLDTNGLAQAFTIDSQIADWAKITAVGFKNTGEPAYRQLTFVPYEQFLRMYKTAAPSVSAPSVWSLYAGQIWFDTIPPALTDSVEITHEVNLVDLTADASVPSIPEKYKHVIKSGAKAAFWDFDDDVRGDRELRRFEGQAYEKGVGGLIGDMILEDNEQVTGPHEQTALGTRGVIFGRR